MTTSLRNKSTRRSKKFSLIKLARDLGGKLEEVHRLPDGSGFATMSLPLPKGHWLTKRGFNKPPMLFRLGTEDAPRCNMTRVMWAKKIRTCGKYAIRASTGNGKIVDFDPDAMLQNLVVGMLGYWTPDGLSRVDNAHS